MTSGRMNPDFEYREVGKMLAKAVLLDWKGLIDDDGKEIPYSMDVALELLTNPEYRRFREFVNIAADDEAHFQDEIDEEAIKN
jgi:hypothetical protein